MSYLTDPFVASIPIPDSTYASAKLQSPDKWMKQHAGLLVMVTTERELQLWLVTKCKNDENFLGNNSEQML